MKMMGKRILTTLKQVLDWKQGASEPVNAEFSSTALTYICRIMNKPDEVTWELY